MPDRVLMLCGHVANARTETGMPSCAICAGIDVGANIIDTRVLDLSGRKAHCAYNHIEANGKTDDMHPFDPVPSSRDLWFFEYRGPESRDAIEHCKHCWYAIQAHAGPALGKHIKDRGQAGITDHEFEPHGAYEYDLYYCACRGTD